MSVQIATANADLFGKRFTNPNISITTWKRKPLSDCMNQLRNENRINSQIKEKFLRVSTKSLSPRARSEIAYVRALKKSGSGRHKMMAGPKLDTIPEHKELYVRLQSTPVCDEGSPRLSCRTEETPTSPPDSPLVQATEEEDLDFGVMFEHRSDTYTPLEPTDVESEYHRRRDRRDWILLLSLLLVIVAAVFKSCIL
mmetsp:Transcript_986/g.1576  ORF Transcript_986/g.1576 Transcript_986/m.1576 type:complete len:197 (+) Transcript_986:308-898(+)